MSSEFHPPVEQYLQAIASLSEEGRPVIQARLAERLGKTPPSVGEMVERLVDDGYVQRAGRRITLTKKGHTVAESVTRKHRLAERLLVDVIKLPWHLVHLEADRWEARHLRRGRSPSDRTPRGSSYLPPRQPHPRQRQ